MIDIIKTREQEAYKDIWEARKNKLPETYKNALMVKWQALYDLSIELGIY